jgi:hypothetical protein
MKLSTLKPAAPFLGDRRTVKLRQGESLADQPAGVTVSRKFLAGVIENAKSACELQDSLGRSITSMADGEKVGSYQYPSGRTLVADYRILGTEEEIFPNVRESLPGDDGFYSACYDRNDLRPWKIDLYLGLHNERCCTIRNIQYSRDGKVVNFSASV